MKLIAFIAGIQTQLGKSYLLTYSKPQSPWQYNLKQGQRQKKTTPVKYTYNSPLPFQDSLFFLESMAYIRVWWATRIHSNCFPWPLYKGTGGKARLFCNQTTHTEIKQGPGASTATVLRAFLQPGWRMLHCLTASDHVSLPVPCLQPLPWEGVWKTEASFAPQTPFVFSPLSPISFSSCFSQNCFIFFSMLLPKNHEKENIQKS